MSFEITPITDAVTEGILLWCGVESPTPVQLLVAEMAGNTAKEAIRFYRRQQFDADIEPEYTKLAVEIGVLLYSKRGVDGTTSFSENGIARSFEKGSIPPSMLERISLPLVTG